MIGAVAVLFWAIIALLGALAAIAFVLGVKGT